MTTTIPAEVLANLDEKTVLKVIRSREAKTSDESSFTRTTAHISNLISRLKIAKRSRNLSPEDRVIEIQQVTEEAKTILALLQAVVFQFRIADAQPNVWEWVSKLRKEVRDLSDLLDE